MTTQEKAAILASLKVDLGIKTTAYDERLSQIIDASADMIATEGASLDYSDVQDVQLIVMYAAWLWRRRDSGDGMPRMLRWTLNNRILGAKMQ